MLRKLSLVVLLLTGGTLFAQEVITTNLISYTNTIIDGLPSAKDNNDYVEPVDGELSKFRDAVNYILNKDYAGASTKAAEFGYKFIKIIDNSETVLANYYMLKTNSVNHWGTFIFAENPLRSKLVIQIPHPKNDRNTGDQGIYIYRKTGAFAFFLAGTHRCNSSYYSDCDGTTTACSVNYEPYKKSDQAHNVKCTFQKATEVLENKFDSLLYFQFHGFTKYDSDPFIIMSNGTQSTPNGTDYLSVLADELKTIDPDLTSKIAHVDVTYTKLIATTNTQGRLINGSNDPCDDYSPTNSGRFIHLEQEYERLRKSETEWLKMTTALNNIIPADKTTGIEDEPIIKDYYLANYPNPFNPSTTIRYGIQSGRDLSSGGHGNLSIQHVWLKIYDILGNEVAVLVNEPQSPGYYEVRWNAEDFSSGIYLCRLTTGNYSKTKKLLLLK